MNVRNALKEDIASNGTMCLKFIDTDQEKAIDLGVGWPYEKLEPYECLISSAFSMEGVLKGDKIVITVSMTSFWMNLRN